MKLDADKTTTLREGSNGVNGLKQIAPSTVNRGKTIQLDNDLDYDHWQNESVSLTLGDSLNIYRNWDAPTVIVSDGAY